VPFSAKADGIVATRLVTGATVCNTFRGLRRMERETGIEPATFSLGNWL
jgi:hypothetical protein